MHYENYEQEENEKVHKKELFETLCEAFAESDSWDEFVLKRSVIGNIPKFKFFDVFWRYYVCHDCANKPIKYALKIYWILWISMISIISSLIWLMYGEVVHSLFFGILIGTMFSITIGLLIDSSYDDQFQDIRKYVKAHIKVQMVKQYSQYSQTPSLSSALSC